MMNTAPLTGEELWESLRESSWFQFFVTGRERDEQWRRFCHRVAPLLEHMESAPLDARTFAFLRREIFLVYMDGDWVTRLMGDYPDDEWRRGIEANRRQGYVRRGPIDDDAILFGNGNLSDDILDQWRQGGMTIRDLLTTEPMPLIGIC